MLAIGCTGGIGAGKSTVTALLAGRGAKVLDADEYARDVLKPGTLALDAVVERFGSGLLDENGALDRQGLASIVFADDEARRALEEIVHPVVEARILAGLAESVGSDDVVVADVALLVERDGRARYGLDGVIVVDADEDTCLRRLVNRRGMQAADAVARIAAQMDRFERIRAGDFVILNIGSLDELEEMAEGAWAWIDQLRQELGR